MILAGRNPERIAAVGSVHGGSIATDAPDSPHLLADRMRATIYVAGATHDKAFTHEQAEMLDAALTAAHVRHTIETYPAEHGFAVPDVPAYDEEASRRQFVALGELFGAALQGRG
jgi:carboxymethylenebutenolidase